MYCVTPKGASTPPPPNFPTDMSERFLQLTEEMLSKVDVGSKVIDLNPLGDVDALELIEIINPEVGFCKFRHPLTGQITEEFLANKFLSVAEAMDFYHSREKLWPEDRG